MGWNLERGWMFGYGCGWEGFGLMWVGWWAVGKINGGVL